MTPAERQERIEESRVEGFSEVESFPPQKKTCEFPNFRVSMTFDDPQRHLTLQGKDMKWKSWFHRSCFEAFLSSVVELTGST